ncbi:hypothetical protein [Nocardioides sp.]|uniref:hypothetical protein n=1 Tax=Nocardioides sp. TaxID=35761 RepID=UPI002C46A70C|nr:hypothetical protein [Nocardioides sp.]HXH80637.1 hypothetical protein [Nocardioides sp.]
MEFTDLRSLGLDDDDLRRHFDTIAARAAMPVVDPIADLRRAREARRRRRVTQAGGGLLAAAAVSALVIGNLSGGDPDAGSEIADDPTSTTNANAEIGVEEAPEGEDAPEGRTFRAQVGQVLERPAPWTMFSGALYDSGATSLVYYGVPWSDTVSLDIRAGVSREVLEWGLATDTSEVPVGEGMGETGTWPGGRSAYLFDQPDGDVVLVLVEGPAADAPPDKVIFELLTDLDVPASTLTPAQVWYDTMLDMGLDHLYTDETTFATESDLLLPDLPSVRGRARQGKRRTGQVEWQAQIVTADTVDCPPGFANCGTLQIAGETFRSLYVERGERAGWLYLERDHGGVRARMILEPYEGGWALPLDRAAALLLDGRWSELAPESSVPYPAS